MILVVGGTGRLGTQVVAGLLTHGHRVRVLSRGVRPVASVVASRAEVVTGSVSDEAVAGRAVAGVRTVVSAVTGFPFTSPQRVDAAGNEILLKAAERAGADVVLVSVAGAAPDSAMELFRAKHAAEQALAGADVRSTVVRPEAFADLWIELMASSAGRARRPLVFGRGGSVRGWVAVRDVAALCVRAVEDEALRSQRLTICGPERLTPSELARLVMAARGWPGEPRHVPSWVLRSASVLPGRAGRQSAAALAMEATPGPVDDSRTRVPGLPVTTVADLLTSAPHHE